MSILASFTIRRQSQPLSSDNAERPLPSPDPGSAAARIARLTRTRARTQNGRGRRLPRGDRSAAGGARSGSASPSPCWRRPSGRGYGPRSAAQAGLSVLLVTVDTLRADALGAYGNRDAATPWMDRLAGGGRPLRRGARPQRDHAALAREHPLRTHPFDHGVRDNSGLPLPGTDRDARDAPARRAGYRTGAFVSALPLASRFGLGRGFDVYDDSFVGALARPTFLEQERAGAETVAPRAPVARRGAGRALLLLGAPLRAALPLRAPRALRVALPGRPLPRRGGRGRRRARPPPGAAPGRGDARAARCGADRGPRRVARASTGRRRTGSSPTRRRCGSPSSSTSRGSSRPRVVSDPARHVDLLPTILDALALPVPEGLARPQPARAWRRARRRSRTRATSRRCPASSTGAGRPLYGVIRSGGRSTSTSRSRSSTTSRPTPARPTTWRRRGRRGSRRCAGRLAPLRAADRGARPAPESEETRERLRSPRLRGLRPGPGQGAYGEDDDPKRLIALDAQMEGVVGFYLAGDLPAALARARELVRRRPRMRLSLLQLAHLERESGHLPAAIEALRRALVLDPGDDLAALAAGRVPDPGRPARRGRGRPRARSRRRRRPTSRCSR